MQTVTISIPDEALEMVEAAAKGFGWQSQVADGNGQMVANPQSALQCILVQSINMVKSVAINQIAAQRAAAERVRTVDEMTVIANAWLTTLSGGGQ